MVEHTELASKQRETNDYHEHLEARERESQQMHRNLDKLKSKGHDMAALNPMVGGY